MSLQALQELPKEKIFLGIKGVQFLLLFINVIVEIVQVAAYTSLSSSYYGYGSLFKRYYSDYSDYYPSSPSHKSVESPVTTYFTDATNGKGGASIWVYLILLITLGYVIGYAVMFKNKIWVKRSEIHFIAFDAAFVILWITEVFTNLVWAYKGRHNLCYVVNENSYIMPAGPRNLCNAYTASNVIGWMILISFILATGYSWKVYNEEKIAAANPTDQFGNNNMTYIPQQPQPSQYAQEQQQFEQIQLKQ
ncbi:5318_t:CDS:2 [Diversispora eburnea]|uniref:5318_t:CDS:1 n=1 Tax=Diversispora eburnea TaxID=1213867 RepID=A0A9N8ZXI3_9GLOM|nr:5318_t:CDS:2 [Diversispora eburnea]